MQNAAITISYNAFTFETINMPKSKFLRSLLQLVAVILIGIVFYALDEYTVVDKEISHAFILFIATFKTYYFLSHHFERVKESSDDFISFMKLMGMNIMLTVLSFASDFYILFHIYPESFSGLRATGSDAFNFFEFVYFSVTTFSTTGLGDIYPNSLSAKYLVCMEVIISFVTIIFMLSNFAHIRQHVKNKKE